MIALVIGVIVIDAASWWLSRPKSSKVATSRQAPPVPVVTAKVERRDVPVRLVITLYITPVIYLHLDRYSGKGPITVGVSPRVQATT